MPALSECCTLIQVRAGAARDARCFRKAWLVAEQQRRDRVFHAKGVCQPQTKGRSRPSSRRTSTQPMGARVTGEPSRRDQSGTPVQTAVSGIGQSGGAQAFVRLNRVLAGSVFFIRSWTSVIVSYQSQIGAACGGDIAGAAALVRLRQSLFWALLFELRTSRFGRCDRFSRYIRPST